MYLIGLQHFFLISRHASFFEKINRHFKFNRWNVLGTVIGIINIFMFHHNIRRLISDILNSLRHNKHNITGSLFIDKRIFSVPFILLDEDVFCL